MGNITECCGTDEDSYDFYIKNSNIILGHEFFPEITILEGIKNEKGIEDFISLINIIKYNILKCPKQKILKELKLIFRRLFETFLNKAEISKNLEVIELFIKNRHKENKDSLLNLFKLFKLIYSKKEEIKEEKLRNFFGNIKFVLETNEILQENNINKFENGINKIFFEENNPNKYLNIENEDILTTDEKIEEKLKEDSTNEQKVINYHRKKEENIEENPTEKFCEELEKISSSSLKSFSFYSKFSKSNYKIGRKNKGIRKRKKREKKYQKKIFEITNFLSK